MAAVYAQWPKHVLKRVQLGQHRAPRLRRSDSDNQLYLEWVLAGPSQTSCSQLLYRDALVRHVMHATDLLLITDACLGQWKARFVPGPIGSAAARATAAAQRERFSCGMGMHAF